MEHYLAEHFDKLEEIEELIKKQNYGLAKSSILQFQIELLVTYSAMAISAVESDFEELTGVLSTSDVEEAIKLSSHDFENLIASANIVFSEYNENVKTKIDFILLDVIKLAFEKAVELIKVRFENIGKD